MTDLVGIIRDIADERCLVSRNLTKEGCRVSLNEAPEQRLIVDFDKPGSPISEQETRCDYLFVADEENFGWIVPIEVKRGKLHAGEVIQQLNSGAKIAEMWVSHQLNLKFRPLAVCGTFPKAELIILKKNPVKFHHCYEIVRTMKCGSSLKNKLK